MMSQFERFGKYILLEKLASGGMAEIYLAKSIGAQGINKFLAVKRILPQFCENPEFKEMFREEAKVSVNLRHSNVVPIFDFGEERNQFYLVMDYVEGRNLRQILNELKKQQIQFSIEQICYLMRDAAAGLDHAHRCIDGSTGRPLNIIHRDISPQNIMVSFDGEVKIIDFGIAKAETQLEATKAGTLKGKFGYMSPEQADGQNIDVRTDIFSLGIVLWELLANDRLFTSSSEAAILRKIRECQIPAIRKINPSVPPELEKIVSKVLAKDPNLRYQTAAALHKDLSRFLNTQFPDFNPQDFSIFIKNTFAAAYQDSKRKLVDYAKVSELDEKQSSAITPPPVPSKASSQQDQRIDATIIDQSILPNEDLQIDPHQNTKVDLTDLKKERSQISYETRSRISRSTNVTKTGVAKTNARTSASNSSFEIPDWIIKLGITSTFVAAGFWTFKSGMLNQFLYKKKPTTIASENPAQTQGVSETASKVSYQVTINSDPSGARLLLDCQDQGVFTPQIMTIEGQKPIHVTLQKEGYYPYEIEFTAIRDAQTLLGKLQPLGRVAYVSIQIVYGGVQPTIEINGRRVCSKSDGIELYPIPAGIPVQIRARNPHSGAMAEASVTLEADQKKKIELVLGSAAN